MIWIFVQYHWGLLIVEGKGLTGLCEWPISELTEGQFNGIVLYVVPRRWNNAMPLELTEIQTNCIFTLICFSNILVYWLICYLFIILFSYLPTCPHISITDFSTDYLLVQQNNLNECWFYPVEYISLHFDLLIIFHCVEMDVAHWMMDKDILNGVLE